MLHILERKRSLADRSAADSNLGPRLTRKGERFLRDFGIDLEALLRARRSPCRACLDWSERRTHLAGGLGAALLTRFSELGWISRAKRSRAVRFTPAGDRSFAGLRVRPRVAQVQRLIGFFRHRLHHDGILVCNARGFTLP